MTTSGEITGPGLVEVDALGLLVSCDRAADHVGERVAEELAPSSGYTLANMRAARRGADLVLRAMEDALDPQTLQLDPVAFRGALGMSDTQES